MGPETPGIIPALAGNTLPAQENRWRRPDHPRSRGEYGRKWPAGSPGWGSSPLSRGIRSTLRAGERSIRIIPALAGNTVDLYGDQVLIGDHPRSRGEYASGASGMCGAGGSSPLSRGILSPGSNSMPSRRIIPALAGNTGPVRVVDGCCSDHPRSRGEYLISFPLTGSTMGSSPLSRGILTIGHDAEGAHGIIPALAGNTRATSAARRSRTDHPRSRGEYSGFPCFRGGVVGSSPLSRGIPEFALGCGAEQGIIPALAGNTPRRGNPTGPARDHPRSRGEYTFAERVVAARGGSSPLSRGIRSLSKPDGDQVGIIPALAGNTSREVGSSPRVEDHPRSRGEYVNPSGRDGLLKGSSPLSRGILRRSAWPTGLPRIIPALAGNTAMYSRTRAWSPDHPRSRGEYIWRDPFCTDMQGSSPLSRGIHLLTRDFISWTCRILGTPSSHVSASRSHSPRVCGDRPPGDVSRLARRLKDLGGPSGLAPHNRLAPMDHPMSGRTFLARSWRGTP